MLHIQVPVCLTYHLHVSMLVAQGSSRVQQQLCACRKRDSCAACVPVRFLRGDTRPDYISRGAGLLIRNHSQANHERAPVLQAEPILRAFWGAS